MRNPYSIDVGQEVAAIEGVRFAAVIEGEPKPLSRPIFRTNPFPSRRGQNPARIVNPSQPYQRAMRDRIIELIGRHREPFFTTASGGVSVNLTFFMPRPGYHFLPNCPRSIENLRGRYRSLRLRHLVKPDIDNLAKFVLDLPLTGTIFGDDKSVTLLSVKKMYDSVGECRGRTAIEVLPNIIDLSDEH